MMDDYHVETRTDVDRYRDMAKHKQIGWWESNVSTKTYRYSGNICELLGLKTDTITFDEFLQLVRDDYRKILESEFFEYSKEHRDYYDRSFPVITSHGEIWLNTHYCYAVTNENGKGSFGIIEVIQKNNMSAQGRINESDMIFMKGLETVTKSLSIFFTEKDERTIIYSILESILNFYHGNNAYLFEYDEDGIHQTCSNEVTNGKCKSFKQTYHTFRNEDLPWETKKILSNTPIVIENLEQLPPEASSEYDLFRSLGVKSFMEIPLINENRVWGYIGIDTVDSERRWSNDDYIWLTSMGVILSVCTALHRSKESNEQGQLYKENLINHMPIGYGHLKLLFDHKGQVVDFLVIEHNSALTKMMAATTKHIGMKCSQIHDLSYTKQRLAFLQEIVNSSEYKECDITLPSGRFVHNISYLSGHDEVVDFYLDTTETVKANQAARFNEKLFHYIFVNIPIGEAIYDINGCMTDVNNAFMKEYGMTSIKDTIGYTFFEDRNLSSGLWQQIVDNDILIFSVEYDFSKVDNYKTTRKDVAIFNYKLVKLFRDDSELYGYLLICIEDTDRMLAMNKARDFETFFSLISNYAKIGYAKYNLISTEGYAISQWYKNMGEEDNVPMSDIVGKYPQMHPDDRRRLQKFVDKALHGEQEGFVGEIRIHRADTKNEWKWIYKNLLVTQYEPEKGIIEIVGVNYDITEFKETQLELTAAKEKAENMDRLKSAFLANMSHEIRTPLNSILGFSELLIDCEEHDDKNMYMSIIRENNNLLLQLINDILDLSKMEVGMMEFHYSVIDINMLCKDIVQSLKSKLKQDVNLLFTPSESSCFIYTDKMRIQQVLTNFINNASKFTVHGSITISYSWQDDKHIIFRVADTGIGIDKEKADKVFDRFVKLNAFVQGTGLGLSICKSIIEQMKGTIGVNSVKGKGSTFWFVLPADKSNSYIAS